MVPVQSRGTEAGCAVGGTLPLPAALHQGQTGRKSSCCACPGSAVHAELVPARTGITPYPRAVTPSHCCEVGTSRAQRESGASLPAVFLLAGTSPSSCSQIRECCCLLVTDNRGWVVTSGGMSPKPCPALVLHSQQVRVSVST